jgi:hypothetical protein
VRRDRRHIAAADAMAIAPTAPTSTVAAHPARDPAKHALAKAGVGPFFGKIDDQHLDAKVWIQYFS